MRVKEYIVLSECVERGVEYGINRAHKHNDKPSRDEIASAVIDGVMLEIAEYFNFDEEIDVEIRE